MKNSKKKNSFLIVILWILLLPIMLCIWIYKTDKIDRKFKIPAIVGVIVVFMIIGAFSSNEETQFKEKIIKECYGQVTYDKLIELGLYEDLDDISSSSVCSSLLLRTSDYQVITVEMDGVKLSGIKLGDKFVFTEDRSYDIFDPKTMQIKVPADPILKAAREEKEKVSEFANDKKIESSLASQLLQILEKINIPADKTNDYEKIENWANGERYTFRFEGNQLTIYLDNNRTINSINLGNNGNVKLYAVGQTPRDIEDFILSIEEKVQIQSWAKEDVKSILKSPSSAEFPGGFFDTYKDWTITKNGNLYLVSSYVDAQNSFGAMIRSEFYIEYTWDGINNGKRTKFIFDGKVVY
ncbi:MAG: hypothetical protein A2Y20_07630 [Firmicutes bacterium GWF2_51_9]|nr:MAG: hypothetical protein A2Y20_07630 [Firmicutes bacterium GWF2_51_9]OGS59428.1 MAG: hypothetical protein A2Y19_09555 [Firmicutes bacterium GWE2_51_13]HAM62764.1 hypothetical protein [Erysipelotrichaceae bacterium]